MFTLSSERLSIQRMSEKRRAHEIIDDLRNSILCLKIVRFSVTHCARRASALIVPLANQLVSNYNYLIIKKTLCEWVFILNQGV